MTFKDSIESIAKFEFEKKAIIDGLLQAETNEEKIIVLRILSRHDLLSRNGWIGDCPDFIHKIVKKQDINRYETRYFMYYLEFVADDVYDELNARGKTEEQKDLIWERINRYLINKIFEYVKKHRIIGHKLDW